MYYKNNLYITEVNINTPPVSNIIIQIHNNSQKTNPIHTIISRGSTDQHSFLCSLQAAIDTIYHKYPTTSISIQSDINIDLLRLKPQQPLYNFLIENNLHTTITTPTRYDDRYNSHSLIDVILTTLTEVPVTAGTISPPLSDHLPVYTIFHTRQKQILKHTLSLHRYEKHKDIILQTITDALTEAQNTTNPNTTTTQHLHNIQSTLQHIIHAFSKKPTARRKQWCTTTLKKLIRKQHTLYTKRIKTPTPHNIKAHSKFRNYLHKRIKIQKNNTTHNYLKYTNTTQNNKPKYLNQSYH